MGNVEVWWGMAGNGGELCEMVGKLWNGIEWLTLEENCEELKGICVEWWPRIVPIGLEFSHFVR